MSAYRVKSWKRLIIVSTSVQLNLILNIVLIFIQGGAIFETLKA